MSSLGQRAADTLLARPTKAAAPKWLKMRRRGRLSDAGLNTVTRAMPPNTFRTSDTLGRGQMNLAQRVYGNMPINTQVPLADIPSAGVSMIRGTPHYAGEMVRKLPTRIQPDIAADFKPVNVMTNALNARFAQPNVPPPLTPYVHIGERGAFQIPAGRRQTPMPPVLAENLIDLHPGNTTRATPQSEVPLEAFDFGWDSTLPNAVRLPRAAKTTSTVSPHMQLARPHIDPYGASAISPNRSMFGNRDYQHAGGKTVVNVLARQAPRQNDIVNKYWALPAAERAAYAAELQQSVGARMLQRSALVEREGNRIQAARDAELRRYAAKLEADRIAADQQPLWPAPAAVPPRLQPLPNQAAMRQQPLPAVNAPTAPYVSRQSSVGNMATGVPSVRSPAMPMGIPQPAPVGLLDRLKQFFMGAPRPFAEPVPQTSAGIL